MFQKFIARTHKSFNHFITAFPVLNSFARPSQIKVDRNITGMHTIVKHRIQYIAFTSFNVYFQQID